MGPQSLYGGFGEKLDLRAGLVVLEKIVLSQLGFKPQSVQQLVQSQYKAPGEVISLLDVASLGRTSMRRCSAILS